MSHFRFCVMCVLLCTMALATPAAHAQDANARETWSGSATLPGGAELGFKLHIVRGDEPSATIDIPAQGAIGIPLEVVSLEGDSVLLRIPSPADAEIAGTLNDEGELAGMLSQAGMEFPFKLQRSESAEPGLNRPQHPSPPFPYVVEEVAFDNRGAGVTLAGTLTLPEGEGPFPAAVLISGSGPQDRDETLIGHKPFLVIADHLTRAGVAVLRYDDRGVSQSTGDFATATTDDFTADALAAVAYLKDDQRIAPDRIGLIGHSEGGLVAPMAAAQDTSVAFVVMLAGLGVDGGETLITQQAIMTRTSGAPEEAVETVRRGMTTLVEEIRAGDDRDAARAALSSVLAIQTGLSGDALDSAVDQQIGFFLSPWMVRFIEIDPADSLARLSQPTLALFGELDVQVAPSVNAEPMRRALEQAPTQDITILTIPDLNHLFQRAQTGLMGEYGAIEETINEIALEIMTSWIVQRFAE